MKDTRAEYEYEFSKDTTLDNFYLWKYFGWLQRTFGKRAYRKYCESALKRQKHEMDERLRRIAP